MNKVCFFLLMLIASPLLAMEEPISLSMLNTIQEYSETQILKLQAQYPDDINGTDERGMTALMYAVTFNDPEFVEALINEGADVAATTPQGLTAIDIAYLLNYHYLAFFLLNRSSQ